MRASICIFLLISALAMAQTPPVIKSATCLDRANRPKACMIGDVVVVQVDNLNPWLATHTPSDVILALDGRTMKGLTGFSTGKDLRFELKRTGEEENRKVWMAILSQRPTVITVSAVGAADGKLAGFGEANFAFQSLPWQAPWVLVGLIALLAVFFYLARKSDIIRDPGPDPSGGKRKPYSLSRSQMAWWFFIVVATFVYIFMITGYYDTLTTGVLVLTGISAATGLAATVVDNTQSDAPENQRATLEKERIAVTARISALETAAGAEPPPPNVADLQKELTDKRARLAEIQATLPGIVAAEPPSSAGFILDILREGKDGVSFHRFQIAVWTITLGFIFLTSVWKALTMPDFDSTLLGLMGISSGTYIGFKIPSAGKAT